jgi:hypothetical protein
MRSCRQCTMIGAVALLVLAAWPAAAQTPPGGAAKPRPAAAGSPAAAQTSPEPATASPAAIKLAGMPDIEFYLAHGEADACGRGCNEWIAAEGKIDLGAAQRLRRLLAKLGHRKPPIFFHSPGGSVPGSIELGRLIRDQKLEVSVAHTIPLGCDGDKPADTPCEALKRAGQELEARFDPVISMCNSGCVFALAGGTTRFVPPGVKLGIHDVGFDPEKPPPRGVSLTEAKGMIHARILDYLRDMGIDQALLTAASAVPNESVRFLERDEVVRFGIDRREFGETGWRLVEKPTVAVVKTYFARTGNEQLAYRNALVRLSCGARKTMSLAIAREVGRSETIGSVARPMQIALGGRRIVLLASRTAAPGGFDIRLTNLSADFVESINRGGGIEIFAVDADRKSERSPTVTLTMDGFSDAYAKLRKSCDEPPANAIAAAPPAKPVAVPLNPGAPAQTPPQTIELTRVVAAGQKLLLTFLATINPDCSSIGQSTVRITEPPEHGKLTIENGQGFTSFPKDNQRYDCNTRKSDGVLVFYEPGSGYTGTDSITVYIIFPTGTTSTRHYSMEVK